MTKSDLEIITYWFQDVEDLARFDRKSRIPLNQCQMEEHWSNIVGTPIDHSTCWFMIESDSGEALGAIGLEAISQINRDAVVALFIDKSIRRCGVGIRALCLVLDFAFRQLGLNRVTSYYRADNHNSRDLVSRVGCQVEGKMREAWFANGQFHDMVAVGILQEEWRVKRQELTHELGSETIITIGPDASAAWSWPPQCAERE
ncbi:N-acetyltransferase [Roseibium sp. RKSG952]|nr:MULTISPECIES: GNAT family protein [Alphaproteobacteria]MTI02926.1 N-acetyltransferase [Roseibium sp. RKSG952]